MRVRQVLLKLTSKPLITIDIGFEPQRKSPTRTSFSGEIGPEDISAVGWPLPRLLVMQTR